MKKGMLKINKIFCLIAFVAFSNSFFAQKPTIKEMPSVSFTASKNVVVLDDSKENQNAVKLDSKFITAGTKELTNSTLWEISGQKGRDWDFISGTNNSKSIQLQFKKVGSYSVSISVGYMFTNKKNEDDEGEVTFDQENFITVTNNMDELTQIHADSNFIKLVKRAEDYKVKPKYAGDPTPLIFLAKGYYGMYKKNLEEPLIPNPYEDAITAASEAIELDQNGIFSMPIHKMWLTKFQMEILNNGIIYQLDSQEGFSSFYTSKDAEKNTISNDEMKEAIDQYKTITKNPISCGLLEAAIRYHIKDIKGANALFAKEIPNLLALSNIDEFTESDVKALQLGVILSAQILTKRDGGNSNACKILDKAATWYDADNEFVSLYEKKLNSCKTD